jgi:hypothetical protein
MRKYKIYFEIFGKKMKFETCAMNEDEAKMKVINRIRWYSFEVIEDESEIIGDFLNGFKKYRK